MCYTLKLKIFRIKKRDVYEHAFPVLTQVGLKQLTNFLRTVTPASDLVDCTLVNCDTSRKATNKTRCFDTLSDLQFSPYFPIQLIPVGVEMSNGTPTGTSRLYLTWCTMWGYKWPLLTANSI